VAIGGFGSGPEAELFPVPLVTVFQPEEEMGQRAAQLLLERINNSQNKSETRHIYLQTRLIFESSCIASAAQCDCSGTFTAKT
jgi:DNA-binding LacI/PurR family transcriptional regulator